MKFKYLVLSLSLLMSFEAFATTYCPIHYYQNTEPLFINKKLINKLNEVCYSEFGVMHSGISKTPLWSAEHLTISRIAKAKELKREDKFHPEDRLPKEERAELADYSKSGYDRGHMAPNKDFDNPMSATESFSLANIVPQDPNNNRGVWADIEDATRGMVYKNSEVYVVTGPLYKGANIKILNNRVLVPSHIFKAIYIPKTSQAFAYIVKNEPNAQYDTISIKELTEIAGIDMFPKLSESVKKVSIKQNKVK